MKGETKMGVKFNIQSHNKQKVEVRPVFTTDESIIRDAENGTQMIGFNWKGYVETNFFRILNLANAKNGRAVQIIINDKFLNEVLYLVDKIELSTEYVIKWNRVVYDYYRLQNKSKNTMDLFITISSKVNKRLYLILKGLGGNIMPDDLCVMLAVARYSSTDERRCIKRLTRMIQNSGSRIMSEQMITDIYCKTCADSATNLFCTVMADRFDSFYNSDENYVYSTVNLAILDILEQGLSLDDIYKVLRTYLTEKKQNGYTGRFLLKSINVSDYPRINQVIDRLESEGFDVD